MRFWVPQVPGLAVGLMRIMFGVMWLDNALQKAPWIVQDGQQFGWLYGWIWKEMTYPAVPLYKRFLETVVLPQFTFFGYLSFCLEIAIGVSLLCGVCAVLGGMLGALWQCNIALGSYAVPGEWYWLWPLLIAPHLVFVQSRAGRSLGLDYFISARLQRTQGTPSRYTRWLRWCV